MQLMLVGWPRRCMRILAGHHPTMPPGFMSRASVANLICVAAGLSAIRSSRDVSPAARHWEVRCCDRDPCGCVGGTGTVRLNGHHRCSLIRERAMLVQRALPVGDGDESWTVLRDEYAVDLRGYFTFLHGHQTTWTAVVLEDLGQDYQLSPPPSQVGEPRSKRRDILQPCIIRPDLQVRCGTRHWRRRSQRWQSARMPCLAWMH